MRYVFCYVDALILVILVFFRLFLFLFLFLLASEVIGTACSGSGAPCHALMQLVGQHNYVEHFASETHVLKWQ